MHFILVFDFHKKMQIYFFFTNFKKLVIECKNINKDLHLFSLCLVAIKRDGKSKFLHRNPLKKIIPTAYNAFAVTCFISQKY